MVAGGQGLRAALGRMAANSIFISYRRDDSRDTSARINERLVEEFGAEAVFFDIESMQYGDDFRRHVVDVLGKCRVCLVVIGPAWTNLRNEAGGRRLDDAEDLVRIEVETALKRKDDGLAVIPVLVGGADMPAAEDLPPSMASLAGLHAATLDPVRHFIEDVKSLARRLRRIEGLERLGGGSGTPAARAWAKISASSDIKDLQLFAESFPGTEEGLEARRRIERLKAEAAAWQAVDWTSLPSIEGFLAKWPEHARRMEAVTLRDSVRETVRVQVARLEAARKAEAEKQAAAAAARAAAKAADRNIAGGIYFWVMFFAAALAIGWVIERVMTALG